MGLFLEDLEGSMRKNSKTRRRKETESLVALETSRAVSCTIFRREKVHRVVARKGTVVRRAHGVCKWRHFHRLLIRSIRTPSCTHSRHIRPKVIEFRNFECTNSYRAVGAVNHSIDNSERPCDCPVNDSHEGDSFFSYFLFFGLLGITSPTQK